MSLRQKLKTLGVSRYIIEGSPNGHVNFTCLIPVAGRQAISEQFQGEGDNEFQAVQVAIRRITLWQALGTAEVPTRLR